MASYASYSSGAIALLWVPATSQAESGTARSYDYTGNVLGVKLHIEYTEAAGAGMGITPVAGRVKNRFQHMLVR